MTDRKIETTIHDLLEACMEQDASRAAEIVERGFCDRIRDVQDYVQAGVLTNDRGVVVELDDGSKFQITIVQSSSGRIIHGRC